jgi:glycosyltransferase involved in cell wall biosynthesis
MRLAVIVPMYNEATSISATLHALSRQNTSEFFVVFCNNGSTDNTAQIVRDYIATQDLKWLLIEETAKGTGRAADAAARAAIFNGATHLARTDADCLPASNWVGHIIEQFANRDVEMLAGCTLPRRDDTNIGWLRYLALVLTNELAIAFGKFRPRNFGSEFKGPYMMTSGNNVAISASLYEAVGGFAHTSIEEAHEDRLLIQAVRRLTNKYRFDRSMLVYASARRIQKWGIRNSLKWYAGHYYRPASVNEVDVR